MFSRKRKAARDDDALKRQGDTGQGRQDAVHRAGETTGMFRARTAEAIRVEVEQEVEPDKLPEALRQLMRTFGAR